MGEGGDRLVLLGRKCASAFEEARSAAARAASVNNAAVAAAAILS